MIPVPGKVVGLDLSLSAPGVAVALNGDVACETVNVPDKVNRVQLRGVDRLEHILATLRLWTSGAELAVIEGPAFSRQGAGHDELAGLRWVVRLHLHRAGVPSAIVPATVLKSYATGNGSADKAAMLAAARAQWPHIDVPDDNAADGLWLCAAGSRYLGRPVDTVPASQVGAMEQVAWHDGEYVPKRKRRKAATTEKSHATRRKTA